MNYIRKATINDLEILYDTCRKAYSENFADHWNEGGLEMYLEQVYSRKILGSDLRDEFILYFLAFHEDKAAGFMKMGVRSDLPGTLRGESLEIEKLYVRPLYQGKGIGKKLLLEALRTAENLNKKIVWLDVIKANEKAIVVYKKKGFRIHGENMIDAPHFKDELRPMWRMAAYVNPEGSGSHRFPGS